MTDKEKQIYAKELLEECFYVYDNNIEALTIHMAYILDKMNKKNESLKKNQISYTKIRDDMLTDTNLAKYIAVFERILDTLKSEIEEFKDLSKLEIQGFSSMIYQIYAILKEDSNVLNKLSKTKLTKKKDELMDICYYSEKIMEIIDKEKQKK